MKRLPGPFWLLTAAAMIALVVPKLVMDGMFMDGMLYTCVAKNLAHGIGTFWFPVFSQVGLAGVRTFHEQPPLGFGIESLFFKLLGHGMYVERLFSLTTLIITAWLIVLIWRRVTAGDKGIAALGWLPLFFWITIPVCFWSFQNVMLECTMGVFTTAAIWLSVRACDAEHGHWWAAGAGLMVFCATLTKGLPGFFPLATIFLWWLTMRGTGVRKMLAYTVIATAVPVLLYAALLSLSREAAASLRIYLFQRALSRIASLPTVGSRFTVLYHLLMELLPGIVITGLVWLVFTLRKGQASMQAPQRRTALFFLLAGMAGSFPLMLTLVQKRFYFVPALPLFAIGLALVAAPAVRMAIGKIHAPGRAHAMWASLSIVALVVALAYTGLSFGKAKRDRDKLHDVYQIGSVVPEGSLSRVDAPMWGDWSLQCYLVRYFNISVDPAAAQAEYYLREKTNATPALSGYHEVDLPLNGYRLYRRNAP